MITSLEDFKAYFKPEQIITYEEITGKLLSVIKNFFANNNYSKAIKKNFEVAQLDRFLNLPSVDDWRVEENKLPKNNKHFLFYCPGYSLKEIIQFQVPWLGLELFKANDNLRTYYNGRKVSVLDEKPASGYYLLSWPEKTYNLSKIGQSEERKSKREFNEIYKPILPWPKFVKKIAPPNDFWQTAEVGVMANFFLSLYLTRHPGVKLKIWYITKKVYKYRVGGIWSTMALIIENSNVHVLNEIDLRTKISERLNPRNHCKVVEPIKASTIYVHPLV